jgi:hypothetical protein
VAPLGRAAPVSATSELEQDFSSGEPLRWHAAYPYGDVLDGFSAAGMRDGEVGLAFATVDWPAGDAQLLLGGNVRGVWVKRCMDPAAARVRLPSSSIGAQCASNWPPAPIASCCAWSGSTARCC